MDDIQKSEVVIAKILNILVKWGIQECDLRFEELELEEEYAPFFFSCVDWLESEGVIRTKNIHRFLESVSAGVVDRPVLTSYGMNVLGRSISLGGSETKLSDAVEKVSSGTSNYASAGNFTGGLLAGFFQSFG